MKNKKKKKKKKKKNKKKKKKYIKYPFVKTKNTIILLNKPK